jgi:hypothetical protein
MATKIQKMQSFIRHYREVTGKVEIDMKEVAAEAHRMGWKLPKPQDPMDLLAKEFSQAAREETRIDSKTARPYRVNHAVNLGQQTFWIEIDTAPRKHMHKAATQRREQSVGELYQVVLDLDHWNSVHPKEEPIKVETDLTFDIDLRKNVSDDEKTG